ncbi:CAP domain-containing protein [uncultured Selenomonas sp.]|uniref:CAP domain-containing protein n=1 Tax=uncultured Selenomonas sp. TaxID=159275 RepID=UPI0025CDB122|nr:CAP domain-containing protein [uncultured Selenomonas sp.]
MLSCGTKTSTIPEKAGCDHLLDDETVEQLAKQAIEVAWEEFPSGSLDDEDDDDTTCEDGSCDDEDDDEDYDDDDEDYDEDDDDDEDDGSYAEYAEDVLAAVNRNRTAYGLSPLTLSEDLCEDADIRAEEIVSNFSHTRPNGSSCFTVISGSYHRVAENIAGGHATAEETVDQWMNSPPHRANILDPALKELGVGYCHAPGSAYEHYWVQLFRTR